MLFTKAILPIAGAVVALAQATRPTNLTGSIIQFSTLWATPGREDDLQKLFTAIRARTDGPLEPGSLSFRTTRGVGENAHRFNIFEEYVNAEAYDFHGSSKEFNDFINSGAFLPNLTIEYRQEFRPESHAGACYNH